MSGAGAPIVVARRSIEGLPRPRARVTHQFAAMTFHTAGRSRMEQRAQWTLEAGDVLLVPAGEPHRLVEAERPEFWSLGFCVPCFAAAGSASETSELLAPFERVRAGASAVVRIPAARRAYLESVFQELHAATDATRRGEPQLVQRSLLALILNEVRRAAASVAGAPGSTSIVPKALAFIERNCLRPLTLRDVAKAVDRSPAYVTTALTRATGRSAVQWIIAGRMAEARRLLLHSDDSVDGVAGRVGYADATHFIRLFRQAHGLTPAAWRVANATSG